MKKAGEVLILLGSIISFIIAGVLLVNPGSSIPTYNKGVTLYIGGAYLLPAIFSIVARKNPTKNILIASIVINSIFINILSIIGCGLLLNLINHGEKLVEEKVDNQQVVIEEQNNNNLEEESIPMPNRPRKFYFILNAALVGGIVLMFFVILFFIWIFESIGGNNDFFGPLAPLYFFGFIFIVALNVVFSIIAMVKQRKETYIICIVISSFCLGVFGIIGSSIGLYNIYKWEQKYLNSVY